MLKPKSTHNFAYKKKQKPLTKTQVEESKPQRVISGDGCWCGQPYDHDWPGKADKAPHPR